MWYQLLSMIVLALIMFLVVGARHRAPGAPALVKASSALIRSAADAPRARCAR